MILISLLRAYWKPLILAVILAYCFYAYNSLQRDNASLKAKIQASIALAKAQETKIAEQSRISKTIQANNAKAYQLEIAQRDLNSAKLKKELANEKSNIINMLNDAYQLRVNAASRGTVSEVSNATKVSADGSGNATITLVRAGQSCAIDYNELMKSWLDACKVYECE